MMHADKYKPGYFPAPRCEMRWASFGLSVFKAVSDNLVL